MEDLPGLKSAIATVLRRVRREARLSQQKLADFAGLSRIHIAQLEGRRQNATLNVLLLIAMALNLDGLSLLRMIHEEMLRTGHGRRKSVRRKAERQDEPHQEALPKETGKQSPSPPEWMPAAGPFGSPQSTNRRAQSIRHSLTRAAIGPRSNGNAGRRLHISRHSAMCRGAVRRPPQSRTGTVP